MRRSPDLSQTEAWPAREDVVSVRLFIGNLPYSATEADLRTLFSEVAEPAQVVLPTDRETGRPRGFAFVDFAERDHAEQVINRYNGHPFNGRPLAVSEARAREDRPAGPRPGGYGAPRPGGPVAATAAAVSAAGLRVPPVASAVPLRRRLRRPATRWPAQALRAAGSRAACPRPVPKPGVLVGRPRGRCASRPTTSPAGRSSSGRSVVSTTTKRTSRLPWSSMIRRQARAATDAADTDTLDVDGPDAVRDDHTDDDE